MATQTIVLGAPYIFVAGLALYRNNDVTILPAFLVGGHTARTLSLIQFFSSGNITITLSGAGTTDFLASLEEADAVFTFQAAGLADVTIAGPNHSSNVSSDPSTPYTWTPSNAAELATFYDGLTATLSVSITISDTEPFNAASASGASGTPGGSATGAAFGEGAASGASGTPGGSATGVAPPALRALSDFADDGLDVETGARLAAGAAGTAGSNFWVATSRGGSGTPILGEMGVGAGETLIDRLRRASTANLTINDSNSPVALNFGTYFGTGGAGNDLSVYLETVADGLVSFTIASAFLSAGDGWLNLTLPAAARTLLDNLAADDEFNFLLARPAAAFNEASASGASGTPGGSATGAAFGEGSASGASGTPGGSATGLSAAIVFNQASASGASGTPGGSATGAAFNAGSASGASGTPSGSATGAAFNAGAATGASGTPGGSATGGQAIPTMSAPVALSAGFRYLKESDILEPTWAGTAAADYPATNIGIYQAPHVHWRSANRNQVTVTATFPAAINVYGIALIDCNADCALRIDNVAVDDIDVAADPLDGEGKGLVALAPANNATTVALRFAANADTLDGANYYRVGAAVIFGVPITQIVRPPNRPSDEDWETEEEEDPNERQSLLPPVVTQSWEATPQIDTDVEKWADLIYRRDLRDLVLWHLPNGSLFIARLTEHETEDVVRNRGRWRTRWQLL